MNIMVCTIQRSGSMWFKDELVRRGYPECHEWIHPTHTKWRNKYWPLIKQAKKDKKDFGVKLLVSQVKQWGGVDKVIREVNYPPNVFIRLVRKDVEGQTKSLANAKRARRWHVSTQNLGVASEEQINTAENYISDANEFWDEYLKDKEHIVVYYEDLVADTDKEMKRVVEYIESKR
jgi:LPS sulfotransferase NodH